jgi:hypothetical protein
MEEIKASRNISVGRFSEAKAGYESV